ncbi:MAG: hypothetical protein ABI082_14530 [Dokdonella sp.]
MNERFKMRLRQPLCPEIVARHGGHSVVVATTIANVGVGSRKSGYPPNAINTGVLACRR